MSQQNTEEKHTQRHAVDTKPPTKKKIEFFVEKNVRSLLYETHIICNI